MTHDEVTAAMKAEDVDAGLVEAVLRSRYPGGWDEFSEHSREYVRAAEANQVRADLAAVLPEIQAQALRDEADRTHTYHFSTGDQVEQVHGERSRSLMQARAARLTATSEEATDG